ncbi:hypothetical protein F5884DRAFT_486015 [Xylogone sp. PMI_703]|nr:hypothetical protein F5884DRAFT_486015 [Xylogone sp. PMI_703]
MSMSDGRQSLALRPRAEIEDLISKLPDEVKIMIFDHISLVDVQNLRLASLSWARFGGRGLFPGGVFIRPHRRGDMFRLLSICSRPWLVEHIKRVTIYLGDMSMQSLRSLLVDQRNLAPLYPKSAYDELIYLIDRHATGVYNWMEQKDVHGTLQQIFMRMPNLESVATVSKDFPFCDLTPELQNCWITAQGIARYTDPFSFQVPALSFHGYRAVLQAMRCCARPLKNIVLDSIPVECFMDMETGPKLPNEVFRINNTQARSPVSDKMRNLVANADSLKIGFTGRFSHYSFMSFNIALTITSILESAQHLRFLDLTWSMEKLASPQFHTEFRESLTSCVWPNLERLWLTDLKLDSWDLLPFLFRHARTLQDVRLDNSAIPHEGTSYFEMLKDIRDRLSLRRFELVIHPVAFFPLRLPDGQWQNVPINMIGPSSYRSHSRVLENYVLRREGWPMKGINPSNVGWEQKKNAPVPVLLEPDLDVEYGKHVSVRYEEKDQRVWIQPIDEWFNKKD